MGIFTFETKSGLKNNLKLKSATEALTFIAQKMVDGDPIIFFAWRTAPDNLILGGIKNE